MASEFGTFPGLGPDEERFVSLLRLAPRLMGMSDMFEAIGAGEAGKPLSPVPFAQDLLAEDGATQTFAATLDRLSGNFDQHYVASIPFAREEEARLGAALLSYCTDIADKEERPAYVYITSGGDGPVPRALAALAEGKVETLTCSPNETNRREFYERGASLQAHFFLGPYFDVTPAELTSRDMPQFAQGFDVIQEDTTFQMYNEDRHMQIALVRRNLKPGGVFMLFEKLRPADESDYNHREKQKDQDFKSRFFDQAQIKQKSETILTHMEQMQITLPWLVDALRAHFSAAVITFNSGNFYNIMASEDPEKLVALASYMIAPAIPPEFSYHQLPEVLFGPPNFTCAFRDVRH